MNSQAKENPAKHTSPGGDSLDKLLKLDPKTSLPGRTDGMQAALAYTPEEWLEKTTAIAQKLAATGEPFTVDTIRSEGAPDPDKHHRWGSLMASLAQTRVIEWHGLTIHRTKRGAVPVRVWIGAK